MFEKLLLPWRKVKCADPKCGWTGRVRDTVLVGEGGVREGACRGCPSCREWVVAVYNEKIKWAL